MQSFVIILIVIASVLLGLFVLIQNPKGGGLDSSFSSAGQIGGVKRTADFLEKGTWFLAALILVLSLASSAMNPSSTNSGNAPIDNTESAPATQQQAPPTQSAPKQQAPSQGAQPSPKPTQPTTPPKGK